MPEHSPADTIALVNNHISLTLLLADLEAIDIPPQRVHLIALRPMQSMRVDAMPFASVLVSRAQPHVDGRIARARALVRFYVAAARRIRALTSSARLRRCYVVNADNMLCSGLLAASDGDVDCAVLAEGLMNFYNAKWGDSTGPRRVLRPLLARCLGLAYERHEGHLSGSDHPAVDRVITFAAEGLAAPPERVQVRPWPANVATDPADTDTIVVLETGWARAVEPSFWESFIDGFAAWLEEQRPRRVLLKAHPRNRDEVLRTRVKFTDEWGGDTPLEDLAATIPGATVTSTVSTALATLKLARPDIRCIDFGLQAFADASGIDQAGTATLLKAVGVELVEPRA